MDEHAWLAERFEEHRGHLRTVAHRMLGSRDEADDAVQEAWLRLSRSGGNGIDNLGAWLTTVVARVCLNTLRARRARREEPLDAPGGGPEPTARREAGGSPDDEVLLADSVGIALLVVLDTLTPAERVAFVLHDMFDLPFDAIAPIVGRSPAAARQLASRARRRVKGAGTAHGADRARQRAVVDAFLAASRDGDFAALVAVLDPDVVLHADGKGIARGAPRELRGATAVAGRASAFKGGARFARPALVDGAPGIVVAPHGRPTAAVRLTIARWKIVEIDVITDSERLSRLELAPL
jgi:RNA polymerase sigma factor (sigma-70 family)